MMAWSDVQRRGERARAAWAVVRSQHSVIARSQLLELGFSRRAIEHRLATGRLHPVRQGVYAAGRREVTREGEWMAAVLSCGEGTLLSHESAAALWGIRAERADEIEVSVPASVHRRRPGIRVHRRATLRTADQTTRRNIPLTSPACTLIDLAARLRPDRLEAAINEADKLDLIDPETLRESLSDVGRRPGLGVLRRTLDARTFTLTDTELERRFLLIVRDAGLPQPLTQQWVNGFRVDFYINMPEPYPGPRPRRRDRRPAISPHPGRTGPRPRPRSGAHRGGANASAIHTRPGALRARARTENARRGRAPLARQASVIRRGRRCGRSPRPAASGARRCACPRSAGRGRGPCR